MEFQFIPAIVAGFVGAVVMTVMMSMAKAAGMTSMDMVLIQGAMFTGDERKARGIGMVTHLVMMGAVVFGSLYALAFAGLGVSTSNAWWIGALIGAAHGVVAGLVFAMMPAMHPRMGDAAPATVGPDGHSNGVHLKDPGLFGHNYGSMTPGGVLMAHVIYGLVVGLVYSLMAA